MQRSGASTYFAQDALSSVTSLMDQGGAVTGRYRYDTYGQIAGTSANASSPYTYTGREWDGLAGVYDYRARQYDPAAGRFLSEDPLFDSNRYVYSAAQPTMLTDPTGRSPMTEYMSSIAVGTAIGGAIGGASSFAGYTVKCRNGFSWDQAFEATLIGATKGAVVGGSLSVVYGGFMLVPAYLQSTSLGWKLLGAVASVGPGFGAAALWDVYAGTQEINGDWSEWRLLEALSALGKAGGASSDNIATGATGAVAGGQGTCDA